VKDRCYCLYRENNKFFRTGELEVTRNLDELPIPNYTSFFSQLSASIYGKTEGAACLTTVLIESSRGCWWGDKSRCKFCGITSVLPGYRQKSPERFLDEIKKIVQEYHVNSVFMTDSILPFSYYDTVLPELASWRRDDKNAPRIYYEIKSNIHRKHMARLALAGILDIQPGIESFSSHILHLVKKGVSMLQQVELLKWAKSYGIECIYNIIYGIPYAGVEDYNTMIEVMSKIHHLHPPYCNRLLCFRFSQYASDPDKYKLDHIRPNQIDREAFGLPDSELMDFCYDLAYDYVGTDREELESVYKRLFREVHDWIDDHNIHGAPLTSIALEKSILIKRVFNAKTPEITLLSGSDAQIYDLAQETISIRILAERSNIPVETVREIVSRFVHDGLMLEENGHVLALATPKDFDIWADADLESLRPPLAEQCYCGSLTN
jgi:ribosomal peptide maturation radical SAM protein 1